jgi:predicted tellurium resistance membrane protein TerC
MTPDILFSFFVLSLLEIVLGIDNLIFISLVVQKLPKQFARRAQVIGIGLAFFIRILMLLGVVWIMHLTKPLFTVADIAFSFKDLLLIAGGVFLIGKSTREIHSDLTTSQNEHSISIKQSFYPAVLQIAVIDFIFSFDSIITAVGLTQNISVIIAAITLSMVIMLVASGVVSGFLKANPAFKMLALSFILMIGTVLIAEGFHFHVPRGYIYFSFTFSAFVEWMNTVVRKRQRVS